MAFAAVYDACVLYPAPLRDLLLRLAVRGLFRAHWSAQILEESFRNILANRPDLSIKALERTRRLMNEAVPSAMVTGHEKLAGSVVLPDPDDRHVVAAAIRAGAQVVVTFNLDDFPSDALAEFEVVPQHPDDFVLNLIDLAPGVVCDVVREQAASLKSPARTVADLLDTLTRQGLLQSVARLRELLVV